jgi:hypothetical protein
MSTEFVITGIENESASDPDHHRLVCHVSRGVETLAIWGSAANRKNIDAVKRAIADKGLPVAVSCTWAPPDSFGLEYGHGYWVPQTATLTIIRAGQSRP